MIFGEIYLHVALTRLCGRDAMVFLLLDRREVSINTGKGAHDVYAESSISRLKKSDFDGVWRSKRWAHFQKSDLDERSRSLKTKLLIFIKDQDHFKYKN